MDQVWQARVDLAAAYRLAVRFGFHEGIDNHFTMMVPGSPDRFLLNAFGLHWSEVTASNLLVVDGTGQPAVVPPLEREQAQLERERLDPVVELVEAVLVDTIRRSRAVCRASQASMAVGRGVIGRPIGCARPRAMAPPRDAAPPKASRHAARGSNDRR